MCSSSGNRGTGSNNLTGGGGLVMILFPPPYWFSTLCSVVKVAVRRAEEEEGSGGVSEREESVGAEAFTFVFTYVTRSLRESNLNKSPRPDRTLYLSQREHSGHMCEWVLM